MCSVACCALKPSCMLRVLRSAVCLCGVCDSLIYACAALKSSRMQRASILVVSLMYSVRVCIAAHVCMHCNRECYITATESATPLQ